MELSSVLQLYDSEQSVNSVLGLGKALAAYHVLLQSLGNDIPVQVCGVKSILLGC